MQQKHCEFSETIKSKLQLLDCRIEQQIIPILSCLHSKVVCL